MKRLLSLLFIAAIAGAMQSQQRSMRVYNILKSELNLGEIILDRHNIEISPKHFSRKFAAGVFRAGINAGLIGGFVWAIKQQDLHWGVKTGAGLISFLALNNTTNNIISNVGTLHKVWWTDVRTSPNRTQLLRLDAACRAKEQAKRVDKTTRDLETAILNGSRDRTSLDTLSHIYLHGDEQKPPARTVWDFDGNAEEWTEDKINGLKKGKKWTMPVKGSQASGFLTGFTTAVAGIALLCYKSGWFSSLWS